jgi:osmotically-inducible protein OsmY
MLAIGEWKRTALPVCSPLCDSRDAVTERIRRALLSSPHHALHAVSCTLRHGVVMLRGCVPSYHAKQMAQAVVFSVDRLLEISNELEVLPRTVTGSPDF